MSDGRPTASVVVPFAGTDADLAALCARLQGLARRPGDELIVADNRPGSVDATLGDVRVLGGAGVPGSSYAARTAGAAAAGNDWVVFVDADCDPAPDLLDAYLTDEPDAPLLVGTIVDHAEGDALVERYIARRRKLDQRATLAHPYRPYGQTANLAVRRELARWEEPIVSGGDAALCWRVGTLAERPGAVVRHRNRSTLRALLRQLHRHGRGMAWLNREFPGSFPPPRPGEYVWLARRLLRGGRFAWLDLLCAIARDSGRLRHNLARSRPGR